MKIGVVVSSWGTSPESSSKVGGLSVYAKTLPGVAAVDSGNYGPTDKDLSRFKEWIEGNEIDRVVFASNKKGNADVCIAVIPESWQKKH